MSHRKRWRPSKYAVAYRCNWLRCRRLMQALRDVGRRQLSALALTESDVSNILSTRKLEGELLVGVKRRAKTSQAAAPAAVVNLVNTVILTICCQQTQHTLCSVSIWVALAEYVTNIVLQYRSHDTFFSVFMFLAALMLAASGAYCMGLGDWLSACVLSNLFFSKSLLLQLFSNSHETWHTTYVPIRTKLWSRFTKFWFKNFGRMFKFGLSLEQQQSRPTASLLFVFPCESRKQFTWIISYSYN